MRRVWIGMLCAAALTTRPAAAERLRVVVGGANFRPYPVAVPQLVAIDAAAVEAARELGALLQADVGLARSLELVPPASYLAPANEPVERPSYAAWSGVGASGLVRGSVARTEGRVRVGLRFFDVAAGREALSRSCSEDVARGSRCIHHFMDDVVQYLTGEPGIYSSRIAYVRRVGRGKVIFLSDVDGGGTARVTEDGQLNLLPAWDRSGRYMLYTSYAEGNPDLYRVQLGQARPEPLSHQRGLNTGAAVSPDGKRVALTLSVDGNTEIYVMDWDGTNLRRITDSWGQDVSPSWSPDGGRLAFVSSRSGNPHIYVVNVDGSQARRLTFQGTYNQEPDWSPRADGQIAFTARDERLQYDIFLVHPDTSVITRLTQDNAQNESPSFSPDGHHIAFVSSRGSEHHRALWVMAADGSNPRRIVAAPADLETPAWGPRLGYE